MSICGFDDALYKYCVITTPNKLRSSAANRILFVNLSFIQCLDSTMFLNNLLFSRTVYLVLYAKKALLHGPIDDDMARL